jgi:phage baseplate assembly protein W
MSTNRNQNRAFLGEGWAFPICAQNGAITLVALEEDIRQSILIILGTNRGERVMRPEFGAGLNAFVFEPISETTKQLIRTRVEEALIDFEPRIDVLSVRVTESTTGGGGGKNTLLINIDYRVRATNSISNLVYPFYLEEGAGQ